MAMQWVLTWARNSLYLDQPQKHSAAPRTRGV
jgi:hypothetical protein